MAPSAACSMASVSRALRPRPRAAVCSAARLGCGLGIACSMPSLGMGNEKHELGLAVASTPAATITPVLRVLHLDFYLLKSISQIHSLLFLQLSALCAWLLEGVLLQFTGETKGFQRMTKMISRSKETQHKSS